MNINYFYQGKNQSIEFEAIINNLVPAIAKIIDLPSIIDVCIYDLGKSVYGGIDLIYPNRLGINYNLPYDTVPIILTHELIHVHQKYTKQLKITRKKEFYWHGVLITNKDIESISYEEYINLPWELDAYNKQQKILSQALLSLKT